jgi:hypothetical protein
MLYLERLQQQQHFEETLEQDD